MNLTQSLHRNAQQRPHELAVIFGDVKHTYSELLDRVSRLAAGLQGLGVNHGERVAMLSLNSSRYLEYILATPWAGGVLNPVNIRWSPAEIAYSLDDSGSEILIIDDTFLPLLPEIRAKSSSIKHVIYSGNNVPAEGTIPFESLLDNESVEDAGRGFDDLAGIFYTGGTTGFPKGVMLSHTNLCSSAICAMAEGVGANHAVMLHAAPMFHLADFAMVQATFLGGGTHVIVPAFDPKAVLEAVQAHSVTQVMLVPTMVQMLMDTGLVADYDLSSWQLLVYGASPMPLKTLDMAQEQIPRVDFMQIYGMTELSPVATVSHPENHSVAGRESGRIRSAGRASFLQRVQIVDESGREVPRGVVGEVIVQGPNVMQGYWNRPEATAEAIKDGWMHTGDGGYMDEGGYVYIVDRVKDMIISGGENVYSAEVENVVSRHESVSQCAVIGIPSEKWGEVVHAVIVPAQGQTPTIEEIREFSKQHIAAYKCPVSIELIEAMPLSGAGKILKTELRKPYWEGSKQVN